jgi:hypothetical protein
MKMSLSHVGRKNTSEHNARIAAARLGKKHTEATRLKMKGMRNFLGRKHSQESRIKISESAKVWRAEKRHRESEL